MNNLTIEKLIAAGADSVQGHPGVDHRAGGTVPQVVEAQARMAARVGGVAPPGLRRA